MARAAVLVLLIFCLGASVNAFAAKTPIRATLTSKVPGGKSPGDHVRVTWRLRDSSGHVVTVKHVTLKITCPTGDSTTTALASIRPDGTYRANAVVPPGGIGTLGIQSGSLTFPITNPYHP